jgi:hypothetical protein
MAGDFMVITLNVYLLRVLYQFPPLCSSVEGIFVADGVKTELRLRVALSGSCYAETGPTSRSPFGLLLRRDRQKAEDLLEVEPLVSRVRVMVMRACLGVSSRRSLGEDGRFIEA